MDFIELAQKRYSARNFTDQKLEKEKLDTILEAGRVAPTAANRQPQRILVVQSEEGLNKIGKGARFYSAPVVLIVCADKEEAWVRNYDNFDTCEVDASIITDHMMMAAADLHIDSLWMTWFDPGIIRQEFDIPEQYNIVNLLALGYNGKDPSSPERHSDMRKQINETVFYEKF
jgi:nitroreductase